MGWLENLEKGTHEAVCGWLANGGNAALGGAVAAGARVPGGQIPAIAGGLGILALNWNCQFDPTQPIDPTVDRGFCRESAGSTVNFEHYGSNGAIKWWTRKALRISDITKEPKDDNPDETVWRVRGVAPDGGVLDVTSPAIRVGDYYEVWTDNDACTDWQPPLIPAPQPPYLYQGDQYECNLNIEFEAWNVGADGNVRPIVKISSAGAARASGGIIGGCNFDPVIYAPVGGGGGGDGPPWVAPWAPTPEPPGGPPWWYPLLGGAAAGAVSGAVSAAVGALLDKLFPKKLPAVMYQLNSVCEVDSTGKPETKQVIRAIPELETFAALDARLGAIVDIAQGLKDFKQPICSDKRPKIAGELVSVNFQSAANEVPAKDRVRKEFRYRDQDGHPESFHINHWKDFSWETGDAIVTSKGLPWGIVQVWAATVAEGKRVIAHAASAAGVDLADPAHEWVVSSTTNPRYGRRARVYPVVWSDTGKLMVSKRDGPSGLPAWKRDL